ncbi:DUF2975 domain-containing protein [Streptomonospora sediminis]
MSRFFIILLRAGAAMAILVGVFGQVAVIPGTAANEVDRFPPYEPYAVPYAALAIIGVACVQAALVAVWMLLGMLQRDALFSPKAFRWVDIVIGATIVATLVTAGATVHIAASGMPFPNNMQAVGALLYTSVATCAGVALAMFLVLMRSLLRKATDLQTEMSEVV